MRSSWATVLSLVMFPVFSVEFGSIRMTVDLFVGNGAVLDAVRDDNKFALAHHTLTVAEFHAERALHDEKKLVFVIVTMPEEFSLELDGFHQAIIDFADDAGLVVLGNEVEFFFQVYRVHAAPIDRERFELRH